MKAEVISVGTELLMGELVDTNAAYLSAQLPPMGIELQWVTQARDDVDMLMEAFQRASLRSDLTLTTGGLGPTEDDITRDAIAKLLGETPYVDTLLLEGLKETFRLRGIPMPEANVKQATLIPSSLSLVNPLGTAPGWWVEKDGKIIAAMPGPPEELHRMWEVEVQPRLLGHASGMVIVTRTFKTFGQGESGLNERISSLFRLSHPTLGMYARPDGVHVRVRARARSPQEAQEIIAPVEEELRHLLGDFIWGVDDETLEEHVGKELMEQGLTLATMESCTGGLMAHTITQVPGSSHYFKGGFVTYTNDMKVALGVSPTLIQQYGAASSEVAQDMARAARDMAAANLGVGITGVAGPDELEGKPPGTVHIGLAHKGGTLCFSARYPQWRPRVKERVTTRALLELWHLLNTLKVG